MTLIAGFLARAGGRSPVLVFQMAALAILVSGKEEPWQGKACCWDFFFLILFRSYLVWPRDAAGVMGKQEYLLQYASSGACSA